jgi:hypothetical protein
MQPNHLLMLNAMEKEANPFLAAMRAAGGVAGNVIRSPFAKTIATKARAMAGSPVGKGVRGFAGDAANMAKQTAGDVAGAAAPYVKPVANRVGGLGQAVTTGSRRALNKLDDAAQYAMSGPGRAKAPMVTRWGDSLIGKTDANPMSVRNLGIGAGTVAGGYEAGKGLLGGGASAGAAAANPVAAQAMNQTSTGGGGGAGGFLSNMPKEMQYALAAGVPLALLGAYAGGRGNMMGGLGMGALGLGAAGLGAAGAGYFGDDARRFVGQGANSLMGLFGAGKDGDIMGQIKQLSRLSPEFGVTMLMGRNPGLSREEAQKMYEFLTQNQDSISKMMPAVTGAQTPAVKAGAVIGTVLKIEKAARCWKGYEPVPGKKPYSNDSCRPTGSKKKEKKAAFPFAKPGDADYDDTPAPAAAAPSRPIMKQMPPKPPEAPVVPRDFRKMPKYVSEGQQWAEKAMQQPPASSMVKTQSATEKEAFGGALLGAGARMAGKGLANFAMKGLPAMSRGLVQGAGKATSMVGNAAQAGGRMIGAAGQRMGNLGEHVMSHAGQTAVGTARNPLERFTADAVGTLGGAAGMTGNVMQGLGGMANMAGRGVNMAGRGLQQAGQHTAASLPLSAAGAYGAYQAARPMMPNVQFRNPIADMGGVDVRPMRFQNPVQVGSPPPAPAGARHTARR